MSVRRFMVLVRLKVTSDYAESDDLANYGPAEVGHDVREGIEHAFRGTGLAENVQAVELR